MTDATEPSAHAPSGPGRSPLRRFFCMEDALARARAGAFGPGDAGWPHYERARAAREAAGALSAPVERLERSDGSAAALSLLREATHWSLCALVAQSGAPLDASAPPADVWSAFEGTSASAEIAATVAPGDLGRGRHALLEATFQSIAEGDAAWRAAHLASLFTLVDALLSRLDDASRAVARVRVTRFARAATLLVLVVAVLVGSALRVRAYLRGPNLALGRVTTASSELAQWGTPGGAVDGNTDTMGFHTDNDATPWLAIDLGSPKLIAEVVVYNRTDSSPERAVPLLVELSSDGTSYELAARRDEPFVVWRAKLAPRTARWVRVKVPHKSYLHLNEVEVYAPR